MQTPLYKKMKQNGTTLYVFPSVEEDKNFEHQNDNFNMYLSHYVLVKFPRQSVDQLNFENSFEQNGSSIPPASFKDAMVESLRNYVANHESVIRNSKINQTEYYYDTFELHTTTERIFWKWCKSLGIIDLEPADPIQDYYGADPKFDDNGPSGNTDHFREYLWRERTNTVYSVLDINFVLPIVTVPSLIPAPQVGMQQIAIQLTGSTKFKVGDYFILNIGGIDDGILPSTNETSEIKIIGLSTINTINDTIIVEIPDTIILSDFGIVTDLELYNSYESFIQFICEIGGLNNVQLPNKAYTESFAYISSQHGKTPYTLFNIKDDNNYKPNSIWPILPQEIQAEIQGGENANNPILINPNLYPGDIWAQFDTINFQYITPSGDAVRRRGDFYGVQAINNINPTLVYPDFDGETIDGLTLNLDITNYALAESYIYPIETFNEFGATPFNNEPPKDFEFNAILWYYTIEDVTGNNLESATNLYGVQFLDTPQNDIDPLKTKIPYIQKYVSNGYQDGNAFTFSLDTNISVDSGTQVPEFDPDKIYSLFGMELYYEALTRMAYFNDKITDLINSNILINNRVNDLSGLVFNQQDLESVRNRMNNLEQLLNVYSTLQIGDSDSIIPYLDTTVNPPLVRLKSIDKQYGSIYHYDTKNMFTEYVNVNGNTQITINEQTIPVSSGKDFLVMVNNNDNSIPLPPYETTVEFEKLRLVLDKDLEYKQKIDMYIIPKINIDPITSTNLTNNPINNKGLEFYINFNDGTDIIKHKIKDFDLPVTQYQSGVNFFDEPHIGIERPEWIIRDVFYSRPNSNERVFSFIIEDDLIMKDDLLINDFISKNSRIFIDNLLIETNPSSPGNDYTNLSKQYQVYNTVLNNPSYVKDKIVDIELIDSGTGYLTPGTETFVINGKTVEVEYTVVSGSINEIQMLTSNGYFTQEEIDLAGPFIISGGSTQAEIRFVVKDVTRIDIAVNFNLNQELNVLLTNYDNTLNINSFQNKRVLINKYLKLKPLLTLLKGYKVSITRISETDLPVSLIDRRYNINIEML